jgi:excisionase family DNA binding protein
MNEEFYTVEEVAELLQVTRKAIYDWMREGRLSYIQIGPRRRRITKAALAQFLRAGQVGPIDDKGAIGDGILIPGLAAQPEFAPI